MTFSTDNANLGTSQLAGYCGEIEKLAQTLSGMLSQNAALGMPLGDDRAAIARLEPRVRRLDQAITIALNATDAAPRPDVTPQTRSNGARLIDLSASHGAARTTPPPVAPPHTRPEVATVAPTPSAVPVKPPTPMPSIERCADLLMEYLSVETKDETTEESEVTLQGTNKSLPIPAVFEFLGRASKTGTLRVKTNAETLTFEFARGDIVFSSTDHPPEGQRLGEIMVDRGMVTAQELDQFLSRHDDSARLGSALESEEFIALPVLREALEVQMRNRLDRAFNAGESAFTFSEGGPESPDQRVRMSVPQLLLEQMS